MVTFTEREGEDYLYRDTVEDGPIEDKPPTVSEEDLGQSDIEKWLVDFVVQAEKQGREACNRSLDVFGRNGFDGLTSSRNRWMQRIDRVLGTARTAEKKACAALPDSANAATTLQGLLYDAFMRGERPFEMRIRDKRQTEEDGAKLERREAWLAYQLDRVNDSAHVFEQILTFLIDPVVIEGLSVEAERRIEWEYESKEDRVPEDALAEQEAMLPQIEDSGMRKTLEMRLAELRSPAWQTTRKMVSSGYEARVVQRHILPENFIVADPDQKDIHRQAWVVEVVPKEPLSALRRTLRAMEALRQEGEVVSNLNIDKVLLFLQQNAPSKPKQDEETRGDANREDEENPTPHNALPTVRTLHFWGEIPYYAMIDEFGESAVSEFLSSQVTQPSAEAPDLDEGVWHLVVAEDKVLVQCGPNPFWHGQKPYNATRAFHSAPMGFYGISFLDRMATIQTLSDDTFAVMFDNLRQIMNNAMAINKNARVTPAQYREAVNTFNGILETEMSLKASDAFFPLAPPDITLHALRALDMLAGKVHEMAPANVAQVGGARQTATYTNYVAEAISAFVNSLALAYSVLRRESLRMFDKTAYQYASREAWVRLLGQGGILEKVDPSQLAGEYDIEVSLALKRANELALSAQLIQAVQVLFPLQALDPVEVSKLVLRSVKADSADIDRLVVSPSNRPELTLSQEQDVLSMNQSVKLPEIPPTFEGMVKYITLDFKIHMETHTALREELAQAGMPTDAVDEHMKTHEDAFEKISQALGAMLQMAMQPPQMGGGAPGGMGSGGGNGGGGGGVGGPALQLPQVPGQTMGNMQQGLVANMAGQSPQVAGVQ